VASQNIPSMACEKERMAYTTNASEALRTATISGIGLTHRLRKGQFDLSALAAGYRAWRRVGGRTQYARIPIIGVQVI
jgi:hypothetical protein